MRVAARLLFHEWTGAPSPSTVRTCLRAANVDAAEPGAGYEVVLFRTVTPRLLDLVRERSDSGRRSVIALAARREVVPAAATWQLVQAGAADVIAWDGCPNPAQHLAQRLARWWAIDELLESPDVRETLIGQSPGWRQLLRQIIEVARFTRASVLLTGESGTGKELVARLIHALDARPDKGELVILDCTTVVPTLSGSEFFGHEKGAFTGAISARDGAFAMAHQGTLFLDEVSELPLPLQAELLRVIQDGMYKRVGSNTWRRATFRLVAATNRDLVQEEAAGRFRRDLYYRMAGWTFHLPSLRQRREDIPLLARHFLRLDRPADGRLAIDPAVEELLCCREYAGNIRDLRHLVSRIAARHVGDGPITAGDVPPEDWPVEPVASGESELDAAIRQALARGMTLREITQAAADSAVRIACGDEEWNISRAARRLGVTNRALQLRRAARRGLPVRGADSPPA